MAIVTSNDYPAYCKSPEQSVISVNNWAESKVSEHLRTIRFRVHEQSEDPHELGQHLKQIQFRLFECSNQNELRTLLT